MRSINAAITSAEIGRALAPRHAATIQNELLTFSTPSIQSNVQLQTTSPQCFAMRYTGNGAYATFRFDNGYHYLRYVAVTSASDFQLSSTSAYEIANSGTLYAMRSGVYTTGTTHYVVTAYPSGGAIQVRRAGLTSTSNPVSVSWSNYNITFGVALTDTSTFVRRVEAVCGTPDAGVVVAVGEHDYVNALSTISFYWLPDSSQTPVLLNNFIQMPLTTTYAAWYDLTNYCTHIAAASNQDGSLCIVANASEAGRAVYFTVRNGIESEIKPVIPTDVEQTSVSFVASSITKINGLYYMAGTVTRRDSEGTAATYDGYLTSDDLEHWSFGERSHYISGTAQAGTLLYPDGGASVYYVGNLGHTSASATPLQNSGVAGQSVTVTSDVLQWSNSQAVDSADTLDLSLANAAGAYSGSAIVKRGAVLYLTSGQEGTLSAFGAFGVDRVTDSIGLAGRAEGLKLSGRDIAGKRLADWHAPVDLYFQSQESIITGMADNAGLIVKTNEDEGYTLSAGDRLRYNGLNTPFIAYADVACSDVSLQKAVVKMTISDSYHLSSVGFLVGAGADGNGHVLLVPKANSWTTYGKSTPEIRRVALPSVDPNDESKENTGFNLTARANTLWTNAGNGNLRTAAVNGGAYRTQASYTIPVNTLTDVAVRTQGRRVQLWAKTHATNASTFADNAAWLLKAEYLFDYRDTMRRPATKNHAGIALSSDVWGDTSAFAASPYDDIEQTLTEAGNYAALTDFNAQTLQCSTSADHVTVVCVSTPSNFAIGQYVRLQVPSYGEGRYRITNISGNNVTLTPDYGSGVPGGTTAHLHNLAPSDEWGYADCGKKSFNEYGGKKVVNDPQAGKLPRLLAGRVAFVSDDSTAIVMRYAKCDGVNFRLWSGGENSGGSRVAWDRLTNPIDAVTDNFYTSGSDPAVWRAIFHHGYVFNGTAASLNLPTTGYVKVGDETMRYATQSFYRRGMQSQNTWTVIPTYYAPLAATAGPTSSIRNWMATGGSGVTGDDFGNITSPAGLLVEISSRNGGTIRGDKQYYVASVTAVGSPTPASTSSITLDKQYEGNIAGTDPTTLVGNGDVAIVSGRGQFETTKDKHDSDAPVVYYPCDSSGNQATIQVSRYECFSGSYVSVEDAIKRTCKMAGQRAVSFRNAFTSAYATGNYSFSIGTSATTLPTYENVSDFVLDLNCHIPGNGLGSGSYNNRLNVTFRNYYRLTFQRFNTSTDYTNNRRGNLFVGLSNTTTDVSSPADSSYGGYRWFEHVIIPIGDFDFSGTATGSGANWTHNEDTGKNVSLRIIAQGDTVIVEMNGLPVWTFNLNNYTDTTTSTTSNYCVKTTGAIGVSYASAIGGNSATARLLELDDELDGVAIRKNSTARAGIDDLIGDRHIKSRTTAAGGIEFGQFYARDDAGALQYNLLRDDSTMEDALQLGHVQVIGDEAAGEALNDSTLRTEGYRFDVVSNSLMKSAAQCAMEARLVLREKRELQEVRTVSGYGRIALQPEDKIALVYSPAGSGVPAKTTSDHVIEGISMTADNKSVKATYSLRKYEGSF